MSLQTTDAWVEPSLIGQNPEKTLPKISLVVLYYEQPEEFAILSGTLHALADGPDEIIVIDDASARFPLEQASIDGDSLNASLVHLPQNQGPVGAMNVGLAAVTGDYVHFLASDDTVSADFYTVARSHLVNNNETGIYSTNTRVIDSYGQDLGVHGLPQPSENAMFLSPQSVQELIHLKGSWFAGNATLFAARPLRDFGGFDEALEEYADAFACYLLSIQWGAYFEPRALAMKRDPASGRNMTIYRDREKSRRTCSAVVEKMHTEHADIFSPKFVRRFERRWRFNEKAIRFYNSNAKLSGSQALPPLARIWLAVLFLIYRPGDLWQRLARRRRPQGDFPH